METVANADKEYDSVYKAVIDKMKDAGWIPGESLKSSSDRNLTIWIFKILRLN